MYVTLSFSGFLTVLEQAIGQCQGIFFNNRSYISDDIIANEAGTTTTH